MNCCLETESLAEAFPELLILLLPPSECLGHRHVLTYLAKLTFLK